jgi:hypothetical protein
MLQVGERRSSAWDRNLYFWSPDGYSVSYCVELPQKGHYFTTCCLYHFECSDGYCKGKGLLKCGLSLILAFCMNLQLPRFVVMSAILQKLSTGTAGDCVFLFLTCQVPIALSMSDILVEAPAPASNLVILAIARYKFASQFTSPSKWPPHFYHLECLHCSHLSSELSRSSALHLCLTRNFISLAPNHLWKQKGLSNSLVIQMIILKLIFFVLIIEPHLTVPIS